MPTEKLCRAKARFQPVQAARDSKSGAEVNHSAENKGGSRGAPVMRNADILAGAALVLLGVSITVVSFYALSPKAAVASCLLGWSMLAIAAVDARRFVIPDVLSLPAVPVGLLASGYLIDPSMHQLICLDHVIGAGVGGALFWLVREAYWRIRGREGLGLGDVKLAAAAGAWTGWQHLSEVILFATTVALGLAIAIAIVRRETLSATSRLAFGVFLAPSIWIVWLLRAYANGL
jgi:leader peptidase (prepilin peptidase)/N-methyltransferase